MIPFPMRLPTGMLGCSQVITGGLPQTNKCKCLCLGILSSSFWEMRQLAFPLSVHCSQGAGPAQLQYCMTILLSLVKPLMKGNICGKIVPH